ncbi:hypothetical protein LMG27952_00154 [Paraburkholderia hiiakae]|uniref:Uncharacterized protein n=1 Tax=Paraburkholderia hiiakae TaxID=1081782 RepID=A0ABM8N8K0_9BURK|nr:hypothetical protein LMG27952_00154 [Paraburkholderia hiiakae]
MPSCKSSDAVRVKPWLAHTPQPDEPPPDQPGEPDVPPIGDPPTQPVEVPRSARPFDPSVSSRIRRSSGAAPATARIPCRSRQTNLMAFMY